MGTVWAQSEAEAAGVSEVKRPHYVPQLYLRFFAVAREGARTPTFWVYDKKDGCQPRPQTPINTAVESGFYDLEHEGVRVPVEEMLGMIESAARPILERLSRGEAPRDSDLPLLARFLSHMHVRGPRHIKAVEEHGTILAREMIKHAANDSDEEIRIALEETGGAGRMTVEEVRDWYRKADTKVKGLVAPMGYWLAHSLHQAPTIEEILLQMEWTTCSGPDDGTFLTGDTPVCPRTRWGRSQVNFGGGFANPNTEVTFPLNDRTCLWLTHWRKPAWLPMKAGWVREINRRTAHIAERYVIAPRRSPAIDALVEKSRVSVSLPKFDKKVIAEEYKEFRAIQEREKRDNSG